MRSLQWQLAFRLRKYIPIVFRYKHGLIFNTILILLQLLSYMFRPHPRFIIRVLVKRHVKIKRMRMLCNTLRLREVVIQGLSSYLLLCLLNIITAVVIVRIVFLFRTILSKLQHVFFCFCFVSGPPVACRETREVACQLNYCVAIQSLYRDCGCGRLTPKYTDCSLCRWSSMLLRIRRLE